MAEWSIAAVLKTAERDKFEEIGRIDPKHIKATCKVLAYKARHYVEIERFYPSSKRCSKCGHVKEELGLSERTYRCESCGNVLDRDYNAAVDIRDEGMRIFTEGHSESACGGR